MSDDCVINVFVSYGRKDAATFVDKLVQNLNLGGITVWRDKADLQSPRPWDGQLKDALKHADVVIAVLTPHAVRTGGDASDDRSESVCLDELAFARFSPPPTPIVPILLMECEPPFVIYRLEYLDFLGAADNEAQYKRTVEELIRTIKAVKAGGVPAYRTVKLEPIDFDLYLKAKTRDFVGREWLTDELFDRLSAQDVGRAIILVGEPGWGKSAFAAHLYSANPEGQLLAAHFCRVDRAESTDPRRFIESLIAATALRLPAYQAAVAHSLDGLQKLFHEGRWIDAFERMFLDPLSKLDPLTLGTLPRYLLVDGLDEAAASSGRPTIDVLLAQTIGLFPEWLRLAATSRDKRSILEAFGDATLVRLDQGDAPTARTFGR